MIDETFPIAIAAGAASANYMPDNFNPVPADGVIEIWGCMGPLVANTDLAPSVSVTLGGATPYTPVPQAIIRVNTDGVAGAGPAESDRIMSRQGVRQGTNSQLNISGGSGHTNTGRIRVRFMTLDELGSQVGAVGA